MKVTIFYFSGTGSTWYAANSLAKALNDKGAEAQAISIENKNIETHKLIEDSGKIVIAFPIYCSAAPRNMQKFLHGLPQANGKPVCVLTTASMTSGDGTVQYKKLLQSKGYVFETGMEFVMHNNLNIPGFPDMLKVGNQDKIDKRNQRCDVKVQKMADAVITGKSKVDGGGLFGKMVGSLQRKYYDVSIKMLNDKLMVAHDKCIKCMRCVKMCPAENITFEDGKIEIGGNCMACMRCYHFCPTGAINITEKSLDTQKWPRFKGPTKDYIKTLL